MMKPFKLRSKVLEIKVKGELRQFMAATCILNEHTGEVSAQLMSDALSIQFEMTVEEWNALPFALFETNGEEVARPAPSILPEEMREHWHKATAKPVSREELRHLESEAIRIATLLQKTQGELEAKTRLLTRERDALLEENKRLKEGK